MAYRIEYPGKKKAKGVPVWVILLAIGGLMLLRQRLGQFLLPGDPEVTGRALEMLLTQLRQGIGAGGGAWIESGFPDGAVWRLR